MTEKEFLATKPQPPALPNPPKSPVPDDPPHEDDPVYDVELSTMDKLFSSRRIKKEQAALDKFNKDRKAWLENKKYAEALYERAREEHTRKVETLENEYQTALEEWEARYREQFRSDHT